MRLTVGLCYSLEEHFEVIKAVPLVMFFLIENIFFLQIGIGGC